jgi:Fur family transcriptional regulator, ferric uptake regulator
MRGYTRWVPRSKSKLGDWHEYATERLREAGYHKGGGRERVVGLLAGKSCAVSALEIDAELNGVGRATVYRALDQLEQLGLIRRIELGLDSTGFEKVGPQGHHHHHIVCSNCGKVIPFEDQPLEKAIRAIAKRSGVSLESHDVTLRGTCTGCD